MMLSGPRFENDEPLSEQWDLSTIQTPIKDSRRREFEIISEPPFDDCWSRVDHL